MSKKRTVLIADDSSISRILLEQTLSDDYNVLHAQDGEEVIEIFEKNTEDIELLLLDIRMPKKDGFAVLQFMKQHNLLEKLPVIVITAGADFESELNAYNFGAMDVIHKPFVPQIIQKRIENTLELFDRRRFLEQQLEESRKVLLNTQQYDHLTSLFTKERFIHEAEIVLNGVNEADISEYGFIYYNIRNFKMYNLNYGTEAGDGVLKFLADTIKKHSLPSDIHARFGNDHFVTFTKGSELTDYFKEVVDEFEDTFSSYGMKLKIGLYHIEKAGLSVNMCCDFAKTACDAIYNDADFYCNYSNKIQKKLDTNAYVIQHFDEAINNNYIKVYYQPVMRTLTGKLSSMEALARWIDPVIGFLSPGDFIPVLEENHLITKLDLHMLRLICQEMKEREKSLLEMVPVSFNLSHMDFVECDIFEEVESIIKEYGVARDLVHIEITESLFTDRPDFLRDIIGKFRNVGYQVWMDDFGSGYSSLNVLKDFSFDEIKLDMQFLSSFDENSKKIIESVIMMAKRVGIHTLAEGVETMEQFEYLRSIGCEKAQGYLFSKPTPWKDLVRKYELDGTLVEKRSEHKYYDDAGGINLLTDRAISIIEFDGTNFEFLHVNKAYRDIWNTVGANDDAAVYQAVNSPFSGLARQLRDLQKVLQVGDGPRDISYATGVYYVRFTIECYSMLEKRCIYMVEQTIIQSKLDEEKRESMSNVFNMMYTLFDSVYLLNLATNKFETIMRGDVTDVKLHKDFHKKSEFDPIVAAELFIHPEEREDFFKFTNIDTLVGRLKASERGYIMQFYRTKTENGSYIWKTHTMMYLANSNSVIYCTRRIDLSAPGLINKMLPESQMGINNDLANDFRSILKNTVLDSGTINMFWKDRQRRFIGANQAFLDTYGFKDLSEILGKTDEDMGWHMDPKPFMDDEWNVLTKGEKVINRVGKCIIKGVEHNIMACKEPIYENGKIIGLMGYFVDLDSIIYMNGDYEHFANVDLVTGLQSASGISNVVAELVDGFKVREENFAVIRITVPEYYRVVQSFGEETAKVLLKKIGDIIIQEIGVKGTCGRLYAGNLVILMKCTDKTAIENFSNSLVEKIANVHTILGYQITLQPNMEIEYADDYGDIDKLIGIALGGSFQDIKHKKDPNYI